MDKKLRYAYSAVKNQAGGAVHKARRAVESIQAVIENFTPMSIDIGAPPAVLEAFSDSANEKIEVALKALSDLDSLVEGLGEDASSMGESRERSGMKITMKELREAVRSVIRESQDDYDPESAESLHGIYSDVYKDKHGIRPRWTRASDMDAAGWKAALEDLYAEPADEDPWKDEPVDEEYEEFALLGKPLSQEEDEPEALPKRMGMGREVTGYEKRSGQGDWAGSAGRQHMRVFKGR
jgi:hypothetical protein